MRLASSHRQLETMSALNCRCLPCTAIALSVPCMRIRPVVPFAPIHLLDSDSTRYSKWPACCPRRTNLPSIYPVWNWYCFLQFQSDTKTGQRPFRHRPGSLRSEKQRLSQSYNLPDKHSKRLQVSYSANKHLGFPCKTETLRPGNLAKN